MSIDAGRWRWPIVATLVAGSVCRLRQYGARTSLWHDEAFVALNAMHHSYIGLLGRIDYNDPSPPGFLAVERLLGSTLGYSEYVLRLVPVLASIAALLAVAALARATVSSAAAWFWAVLFAALSDKLIEQSNLVKHFTLEFLLSLVLTTLAITAYRGRQGRVVLWLWGGVAAIGIWTAYGTVFPFAGTSMALLPHVRRWPVSSRRAFVIANGAVLASLALLWFPIRAQWSDELLSVWMHAFPDRSGAAGLAYWFGRRVLGLSGFFWQPLGLAVLVLGLIGVREWWRTDRRALLPFLLLPAILALAASVFHAWPFGGYHQMVFAAGAIFILAADGIEVIRRHPLLLSRPWSGPAFLTLLFAPAACAAAYHLLVPRYRHEIRPVIEIVSRRSEPGDVLVVYSAAEFEFYTGRRADPVDDTPPPDRRVWVIGTFAGGDPFPQPDRLDRLARTRPRLLVVEDHGAAAYLFGRESGAATE